MLIPGQILVVYIQGYPYHYVSILIAVALIVIRITLYKSSIIIQIRIISVYDASLSFAAAFFNVFITQGDEACSKARQASGGAGVCIDSQLAQ